MLWNASAINGYAIEASDGTLGAVSDLLFDDVGWAVRWLVVDTGNRGIGESARDRFGCRRELIALGRKHRERDLAGAAFTHRTAGRAERDQQ